MKKEFIKQNVGIDIAKDDFKVNYSVLTQNLDVVVKGSKTIKNDRKGFEELASWLSAKLVPALDVHFTMEATGVYYEGLAYFLQERGYSVHVVLPNQAKKYGQSLGIEIKTDKIDAKTLARMGLERKLRNWEPFSTVFRELKQLGRERDALIQTRTAALNQQHAYTHQGKPVATSLGRIQEVVEFLSERIVEIEQEIESTVHSDAALTKRLGYVMSIKGVGLITAVCIVAETNGFAAIHSIKQLTSYAGLDIKIRESGTWKGKARISKK